MKKIIQITIIFFFLFNLTLNLYSKRFSPSVSFMKNKKFAKIFKASTFTLYAKNIEETEHFIIYYGDNNPATTLWADYNSNNIPDFIDNIKEILEYTFKVEINLLNFASPVTGNKVIVIIGNTGVKLNSEEITIDSKICGFSYKEGNYNVLVINPIPPSSVFTKAKNMLKVTVAHEFFHIIQFNYTVNLSPDTNLWLYEGTAVWMENQVYPDIDDYIYSYAEDMINYTDEGLTSDKGFHPYGTALFFDFLTNKFDKEIIKEIWEIFKEKTTALEAIKYVIETIYSENFYHTVSEFYQALINPKNNFTDGDKLSEESFSISPVSLSCNKPFKKNIGLLGALYFNVECSYTGILNYKGNNTLLDNVSINSFAYNINLSTSEIHIVIPYKDSDILSEYNTFYNVELNNLNTFSYKLENKWNLIGVSKDISDPNFFDKPEINSVWQWDNETWKIYIPGDKSDLKKILKNYNIKEITSLQSGSGVWINTETKTNIDFNSVKLGNCGIDTEFNENWKLESTACINDISPDSYLPLANVKTIWKWSGTNWQVWSPDKTLKTLIETYKLTNIKYLNHYNGFWVNK